MRQQRQGPLQGYWYEQMQPAMSGLDARNQSPNPKPQGELWKMASREEFGQPDYQSSGLESRRALQGGS
jgi:hypothetical protein